MAPTRNGKKVRRQPAESGPPAGGPARPMPSTSAEEVHITAPENVLLELAAALEQTGRAMPAIRKIRLAGDIFISVYDVIQAVKGCSQENAAQELQRMRKRFGDGCANCTAIRSRDSIGRLSRNETPVADAQNIVKIVLLLPGEQAARVRAKVSEVFVRFLGGDVTLVQDVMRNRELQDL